jgi:hypothetical protein
MLIVLFNFFLFIIVLAIFFYGLQKWDGLITEPEETPGKDQSTFSERKPIWILIIGCGAYSLFADLLNWLNGAL